MGSPGTTDRTQKGHGIRRGRPVAVGRRLSTCFCWATLTDARHVQTLQSELRQKLENERDPASVDATELLTR